MLTFATTYLYPTWKFHPDTYEDEIKSPQRYEVDDIVRIPKLSLASRDGIFL